MSTKEFTQWTQINLRHNIKIAAFKEQAACDQGMKARMKLCIVTESLYGYNNSWDAGFLAKSKLEEFEVGLAVDSKVGIEVSSIDKDGGMMEVEKVHQ